MARNRQDKPAPSTSPASEPCTGSLQPVGTGWRPLTGNGQGGSPPTGNPASSTGSPHPVGPGRKEARARRTSGLQFKVLAALAALFSAFALVALAWGSSFVQERGMQDAQNRAVALSDQMDAVWDYVDENQPATNAYVQEYGDLARGLVCVTAVKSIARDFSRDNDGEIRVVALQPRNKEDSPDEFEREALEAFDADAALQEYSGVAADENGEATYYYLRPRRIGSSCLACHGDPAGETDPLGYRKEGYAVGSVKGAVSIREPIGSYQASAAEAATQGVALFLLGLLAVMGVMYALLRATVIRPIARVSAAASAYRPGAGSARIEGAGGADEVAALARDFNAMADDLDGLYTNLEQRVEERTAELERLNGELRRKQDELADAFAKLQAEGESKDRLFASLSHDLRTPLASIIATTQLAEAAGGHGNIPGQAAEGGYGIAPGQAAEGGYGIAPGQAAEGDAHGEAAPGATGAARDREALANIGEQARTLVAMVDNILAFSRADAHGIELHPGTVDLVDLAAHLRATIGPIAARRGLVLNMQVDTDSPLIEADPNLLIRVLQNLVANAVKFTPAGGCVWVRIGYAPEANIGCTPDAQGGSTVTFAVEDNGVGIATEDLRRIFEPYTKGEYREGGSRTGAGLGLSVIRQIADAMGGAVWAEQREGGGSRFVFRFPATVLDEEDYE